MNVTIESSKAKGSVKAPPSKSMAHRNLMCAALAGQGSVTDIDYSNDILATLDCLEALGAKIERKENSVIFSGLDIFSPAEGAVLDCRESGSTLRFMLPLCMLSGKRITLKGSERLLDRPLTVYEDICRSQGIEFKKERCSVTVCGRLTSGKYVVPGDVSSQFITGLMFALPLLEGKSVIRVTDKFESASYVDLTLKSLETFGVTVERKSKASFAVLPNQQYSPCTVSVEGDYSNAAFLDGFNLLGGDVEVTGLDENSLQGDRVYKKMFAELAEGKKKFDVSDCPDLAPVMFALSAVFGGANFKGTRRLKMKESDRGIVMAKELMKFGVKTQIAENRVYISCPGLKTPTAVLSGHNDHRVVMALSLLCSVTGGTIEGAEAVDKSFPDFFKRISGLGVKVYEA